MSGAVIPIMPQAAPAPAPAAPGATADPAPISSNVRSIADQLASEMLGETNKPAAPPARDPVQPVTTPQQNSDPLDLGGQPAAPAPAAPAPAAPATSDAADTPADPFEARVDPSVPVYSPANLPDHARYTMPDGSQVTVGDLVRGHMRQADYTTKTTEIANMRRELQAERERTLPLAQTIMDKVLGVPPEPDISLFHTNPAAYYEQVRAREAVMGARQQLTEAMAEMQQRQGAEMMAAQQQASKQAADTLREWYPEWKDPNIAKRDWGAMSEYLANNNFTPQEIQGITDPRMVPIIRKAQAYDAGRRAQQSKQVPNAAAPAALPASGQRLPVPPAGAQPRRLPGTAVPGVQPPAFSAENARAHAFKTGRLDDMAAAYGMEMEVAAQTAARGPTRARR